MYQYYIYHNKNAIPTLADIKNYKIKVHKYVISLNYPNIRKKQETLYQNTPKESLGIYN